MRRIQLLALASGLGFAAGCFDDANTEGLPCTSEDSCGEGQECNEGFCQKPGMSINDACGDGNADVHEYCLNGSGVAKVDVPDAKHQAMGQLDADGTVDFAVLTNVLDELDNCPSPCEWTLHTALNADNTYPSSEVLTLSTSFLWGLHIADVSGDGVSDIIVLLDAPDYQLQINAYINDGTGKNFTLVESQSTAMGFFAPPTVGDIDADGQEDIITVDLQDPRAYYVWRGMGGGMFANTLMIEAGRFPGFRPFTWDLDGDSADEVLYLEPKGGLIAIVEGVPLKPPRLMDEIQVGDDIISAIPRDINGDDLIDIVVGQRDSKQVKVLLGEGDGKSFEIGKPIDVPGISAADMGDIDADGHMDLVAGGSSGIVVRPGFVDMDFGVEISPAPDHDVRNLELLHADGDEVLDLVVFQRGPVNRGPIHVYWGNP